MKSKRYAILLSIVLLTVVLAGCDYKDSVQKRSSELAEPATVVDLVYTPSNHGSDVSPSVHMTEDGNLGLGLTFTEIHVPEKYAVVFQCQHGKFIIQDDQAKAKELWSRLKDGQKVTVRYNEVYEEVYAIQTTWWGKELYRELVARKLLKYHFIDAQ